MAANPRQVCDDIDVERAKMFRVDERLDAHGMPASSRAAAVGFGHGLVCTKEIATPTSSVRVGNPLPILVAIRQSGAGH